MRKTIILLLAALTLTACAGGVTRQQAARDRDDSMAVSTAQYAARIGPLWQFTCFQHPDICQEDRHAQENAVPPEHRNDTGFWQNFKGRVDEMGKNLK